MGYRLIKNVFSRDDNSLNEDTALHSAVKSFRGDLRAVKLLLKRDASDINRRNLEGKTPLHLAVENKKCWIGLINLLRKHGARFDIADIDGNIPLHLILQNIELICKYHCQHTKLNCLVVLIRLLLKYGSDMINAYNLKGDTPVDLAAQCEEMNDALFEALQPCNGDVKCNAPGDTPLHSYLRKKEISSLEMMKLLQEAKDVNAGNHEGETPLHLAVRNKASCNVIIIKILLSFGAEPRKTDHIGENVYQAYCRALKKNGRKEDRMLRILLQSNEWQYMDSSLHVACMFHNVDSVKKLLNTVDNVDAVDEFDQPALYYAFVGFSDKDGINKCSTVKQMLDYGAIIFHQPYRIVTFSRLNKLPLEVAFMVNQHEDSVQTMWDIITKHLTMLAAIKKRGFSRNELRDYSEYLHSCFDELKAMSETKIAADQSKMSFLDLLLANDKKAEIYARNKVLVEAFQKNKATFPIYQEMMEAKLARGLERRKLVESAAVAFSNALSFADPSDLIYERIFSYCRNKDLINVINIEEQSMPNGLFVSDTFNACTII